MRLRKVYKTGSVHHMKRGVVKQYKFHEGGFALELAQGTSFPPSFAHWGLTERRRMDPSYASLWIRRQLELDARFPDAVAYDQAHWLVPSLGGCCWREELIWKRRAGDDQEPLARQDLSEERGTKGRNTATKLMLLELGSWFLLAFALLLRVVELFELSSPLTLEAFDYSDRTANTRALFAPRRSKTAFFSTLLLDHRFL